VRHQADSSSDTFSEEWYAIQSKPKQEGRAEADLLAWGVEAFLPRIPRRASPGRGSMHLGGVQPLFPGYLFARFNGYRMLHKIKYTRGVARVLGTERGPTPLDESIIALIRTQVGADGLVRLSFRPGERLHVTDGPLKDFVGVFSSALTGADRVRVLLTAVSGGFKVVVDGSLVERITAA
jgi:transcriptional antiterminator RfaH